MKLSARILAVAAMVVVVALTVEAVNGGKGCKVRLARLRTVYSLAGERREVSKARGSDAMQLAVETSTLAL